MSSKAVDLRGIISDRQALTWFVTRGTVSEPKLEPFLSSSLSVLSISTPDVISLPLDALVMDAMRMMSEEGLSSLPVVHPSSGELISAVSVNDIGRVRYLSKWDPAS